MSESVPSGPRCRRRWRWILSLRALMGLVLAVGGVLGWIVHREQVRRAAVALIRANHGSVAFRDEQYVNAAEWRTWLYRQTGLESCRAVAIVALNPALPTPPQPEPSHRMLLSVEPPSPPVGPPPPRVELFAAVGRLGAIESLNVIEGSTTPAELAALAEASVDSLTLSQPWEVSAEAVTALARLGTLRSLRIFIPRVKLAADAVRAIGRLPTLRQVDLSINDPLASADLVPLGQLRNLEELVLADSARDDAFLDALSGCRRLRVLRLGITQLTDDRLRRLAAGAPDLAEIRSDGAYLTDAGVAALGGLPRLQMVQLIATPLGPARLTDASLVALGRCRSLSILMLPPGRFTDAGLAALGGLPLYSLHLNGSVESCSAATLTRLVAGRKLITLALPGPAIDDALVPILAGHFTSKYSDLILTGSRVTDAGARDLLQVAVGTLNLANTTLGDAGLAILATHPTLSVLNVEDTWITPAGAAAFRRARPRDALLTRDPTGPRPRPAR